MRTNRRPSKAIIEQLRGDVPKVAEKAPQDRIGAIQDILLLLLHELLAAYDEVITPPEVDAE